MKKKERYRNLYKLTATMQKSVDNACPFCVKLYDAKIPYNCGWKNSHFKVITDGKTFVF